MVSASLFLYLSVFAVACLAPPAATTILPAASPYLSSLSVNPPCISDAGPNNVATVTLRLINTAATNTVIALKNNNSAAIDMPNSVTIPAGQSQATFTMIGRVGSVTSEGASVTVSGKSGAWTQAATLTVIPESTPITIENFDTDPGDKCVVLSWQSVRRTYIKGFRVFRRQTGGAAMELTATPQKGHLFADAGVTNGVTYEYMVRAERWDGTSVSSTWVPAIPVSTGISSSWLNQTIAGTGGLDLSATSPASGGPYRQFLLVDGDLYPTGGTLVNGRRRIIVNSAALTNGDHNFQVVSLSDTYAATTPPRTLSISNPGVTNMFVEPALFPGNGQALLISATLPSNTQSWKMEVVDDSDNVAFSVSAPLPTGGSPRVSFAWDGRDAKGAIVTKVNYSIVITAQGAYGETKDRKPVAVVRQGPNALVGS